MPNCQLISLPHQKTSRGPERWPIVRNKTKQFNTDNNFAPAFTAASAGSPPPLRRNIVARHGNVHRPSAPSYICCKCGILMQPNAANMCVKCLQPEINITEDLEKQVTIIHCLECNTVPICSPSRIGSKQSWNPTNSSPNTRKVHLDRSNLIPRGLIKVELTVRKEVLNGAILEQTHVVQYIVHDQMCESCSRVEANPDQWAAVVQLHQHVSHRRTFFYLEQLILKHGFANYAVRIKQMNRGIDFFFNNRSHGLKFVDFLDEVAPIRSSDRSTQLVSHDSKSNNYNYNKYTFSVEICPICREDLICLPPKVSISLGNLGLLVNCDM